jgi:GTP-binding protein
MEIRNVAIIAHVDHGKTTLVDALLRQSQTKLGKEAEERGDLIMDSNPLERERGITIFSKNASVLWQPDEATAAVKINIVDTPGHADFGGEVERVLKMADGALLLVDAKEGPMPQTRFVLKKALEQKLKIIVVINKIDKPDARIDYVHEKTLELFLELGASDEQADFPVIYASAKNGLAGLKPDLAAMTDITPVFATIVKEIKPPAVDATKPLQLLVTTIVGDQFKGRIATGRVYNGVITAGQEVIHINRAGEQKKYRLVSLMTFNGLARVEATEALAGDIVAISGIPDIMIGETIADPLDPKALPLLSIEEPTVKMTFMVNDSPFAGREGQYTTSRQLRERLYKELENDMALRVEDVPEQPAWIVSGRGELHLAILLERLRREGYELQVSRPQVIEKEVDGRTHVPFERTFIETPEVYSGVVIQKLGSRHGLLQDLKVENGIAYLEFIIPTRGLFGYRNEFLTDTKGLGIMNSSFLHYAEDSQAWKELERGSLVAHEGGQTLMYGLMNVQDRGLLFYGPGVQVYAGMVVGEHSRPGDLRINVCKAKHLTNFREKGEADAEHFKPPRLMGLEDALEYIGDDELVEVTPKSIRMRKKVLDEAEARRQARGIKA